jgi:hypothetical protein
MKYIAYLLLLFFVACKEPESEHPSSDSPVDTTVTSYNTIQHGSFDSSNCITYSISLGGRSTGFSCNACQKLGGFFSGRINIMMPGKYDKPVSYRMELQYLKQLLPLITKRFPKDSLDCIALYSIADHPDLAVKLTKEYALQFGGLDRRLDPKSSYAFLDTSVIAKDFNRLLAPYSVRVKRVGVEKLSLSSGARSMLDWNAMESDTAQIPKKVLDGTLWIYVR